MALLQSRPILGARCNADTEAKLRASSGGKQPSQISFILYEVSVGHKVVNCCTSGGYLDPQTREPYLTLIGGASLEALTNAFPDVPDVIFQEVKKGVTPVQEKMKKTILAAPEKTLICFVADLAGEMGGLAQYLNPTGHPIFLNGFGDVVGL